MKHLRYLLLSTLIACGGAPAASTTPTPTGASDTDDDGLADPDGEARTVEDCTEVVGHLEDVTVEAIDQDGMMDACLNQWDDVKFACLAAAADDDGVEACW